MGPIYEKLTEVPQARATEPNLLDGQISASSWAKHGLAWFVAATARDLLTEADAAARAGRVAKSRTPALPDQEANSLERVDSPDQKIPPAAACTDSCRRARSP